MLGSACHVTFKRLNVPILPRNRLTKFVRQKGLHKVEMESYVGEFNFDSIASTSASAFSTASNIRRFIRRDVREDPHMW